MTPELPVTDEINLEREGYLPDGVYELITELMGDEIKVHSPFDPSERVRLSRGARIHIRRLKQAGEESAAESFRSREIKKKTRVSQIDPFEVSEAEDLLKKTIPQLLESDTRMDEVLLGLKTVHLARATGYITDEQMMTLSRDIYDMNIVKEDEIIDRWAQVREEISHLMPKK